MTKKEERFVAGLNEGKSITQAYLDAGYSAASRKIACNEGRILKKKPCIQRALQAHGAALINRSEITADSLIDEMRPIIAYSTADFIRLGDEGLYLIPDAINDPVKSKAIKQIRQTQYGVEIVFHDKLKAIEIVGRMTGVDQPKQIEQDVVRYEFGEVEELME